MVFNFFHILQQWSEKKLKIKCNALKDMEEWHDMQLPITNWH